MQSVMQAYHATKQRNLLPSLEHLVLQALLEKLEDKQVTNLVIETQEVTRQIGDVCTRLDITEPELCYADVQKVGILLSRLGFQRHGAHGRKRSWEISKDAVFSRAKVAGVIPGRTSRPHR